MGAPHTTEMDVVPQEEQQQVEGLTSHRTPDRAVLQTAFARSAFYACDKQALGLGWVDSNDISYEEAMSNEEDAEMWAFLTWGFVEAVRARMVAAQIPSEVIDMVVA